MLPRYLDREHLREELARVGIIVQPLHARRRRWHGVPANGTKDIASTASGAEVSPSAIRPAVSGHDINVSAEALAASVSAAVRGTNASGLPLVGDVSDPVNGSAPRLHSAVRGIDGLSVNGSAPWLHSAVRGIDGLSVNGSAPRLHSAVRGVDGLSVNGSTPRLHTALHGMDGLSANGSVPRLHAALHGMDGLSVNSSVPRLHTDLHGIDSLSANVTEPRIHGLDGGNLSVEKMRGFSTDSASSSSSSSGPNWTALGICCLLGTLALCAGLAGLWMAWTRRRSRRSRGSRRTTLMQDNNSNGSNGAAYRALPTEDLDVEERCISSPEQLGQQPRPSVARLRQVVLTPPTPTLLSYPITSMGTATSVPNGSLTAARLTPALQTTPVVLRPPPAPATTLTVQQTGSAPVVLQSVRVNGRSVSPPRVVATTTQAPTTWTQVPAHATTSWLQ